jgi:hypothetical protein
MFPETTESSYDPTCCNNPADHCLTKRWLSSFPVAGSYLHVVLWVLVCLLDVAAFANRWLVFCYLSVSSGCWRLVWLLPRRVKTTWRKQFGLQFAVSGTTFFTEDNNLQKISCRPTEYYSKRGTKWQLANLEVACRIDVTLTDDCKGKF